MFEFPAELCDPLLSSVTSDGSSVTSDDGEAFFSSSDEALSLSFFASAGGEDGAGGAG